MQVNEVKTEGLRRDFKIVVPADDIEAQMGSRLKELAATVRLPGFRPGKVPLTLLRKKYGPAVLGEIIEQTVNESSQKALTDRGLRPAMQPEIEITGFEDGADLEYTMAVELMPQFEPMDLATIELENLVVGPDEEKIDASLQRLADTQRTPVAIDSDRKSKVGDFLVIDFVGTVDGEEFPGGKAEGYVLELGSASFIPGFEDQLTGAKSGDDVTVGVTFPEDYGASDLAGKKAEFQVSVREIREAAPALIDDDLAQKVGMENLDALRQAARDDQARELSSISRMRLKRALLDTLADAHDFEVPVGMIDRESEQIWAHFEEQRKSGNEDLDPEDAGKSDDELKTEFSSIAERRVRLGLVLSEIGRLNSIQVSPEDLNRAMSAEARRHPGQEQAVLDYYRNNAEAMDSLRAPVYEDKVVDFILEMATVADRTVSFEELLREPDEPTEKPAKAKPKPKKKAATKKKAAKKT